MTMVYLPENVYCAFETIKKTLKNKVSDDELNLIFLNIIATGKEGDLKVLKDYALENPTNYLHAIVFGYTIDKAESIKTMLKNWMSQPYVENEEKDIEIFAERLAKLFQTNI